MNIQKTAYQDDYARLERAYTLADPWSMGSERERKRFEVMNDLIRQHCGHVETILEIGSGEGHHTRYLTALAKEIVGLEASRTAIRRAQRQCPQATFLQTYFPALPQGLRPRYDVVMASEVLYYIRDLEAAIAAMNRYGKFCMVSCYEQEIACLDRYLGSFPMLVQKDVVLDSMRYRISLWRSEVAETPCH